MMMRGGERESALIARRRVPPHPPSAARWVPPSPARGEGKAAALLFLSPCGRGRGPSQRDGKVRGLSTLTQFAHEYGGFDHAVGEAPFVVVPSQHAAEALVEHHGLRQVEGRAV